MHTRSKKITSMILSGALAIASTASSFTAVVPSLSATAADNDNYAKLLQYSLYFYDANMCGDVSGCGLSWRSNCHMDDEVKGGFHDAGDHAMFGLPQGYTASTLGWSYYEFSDAFDATGQTDHLKMITDHFCEFFRNSTKLSGDTVTNFLYQKGDGNEDHSYWGPPEKQTGARKMYWTSNSASDIAAEYAAALAANYVNFNNADDLKYAKALYKFSKQYNSVATEGPQGFYNSNGAEDEQAWAAGWLYIATKDSSYLNDLKSNLPKVGWVHGWNDAHLGADCLYGEITGDWSAANGYISSKATGSGYMFLDKWGSARINCSMQMTALIATKNKAGDYKNWAKGQMNYILGDNPANTCFVTGFASNSAKNAHHRAASGYTSYEQFNMNGWNPDGDHMSPYCAYGPDAHPLIGALVGGPCDASGSYHDNMADYICNEVALDYNAGLVGAAAGLYHFYQTGKTDSTINGVTKIYSGSGSVTPVVTTTKSDTPVVTTTTKGGQTPVTTTTKANDTPSTGNDKVLLPADMSVGQEEGDDGKINNYAEFKPQGAKSATLYLTVKSSDTEVSGGFGTWTGEWEQEEFKGVKVNSDKTVAIDYTIPAKVGQTVKAMVWWPHGDDVVIDKVVLHMDGSSTPVATTTKATTKATTTQATTTKATTTTKANDTPSTGNDKVLLPADMSVGQEKGDDGEINNYAEFKPQGAKSATLYLTVKTNDTEVSGGFGTWTGEWEQEEFKGVKVNSDKTVAIDYTIPAKVGQTVKAMVWWPHADGVVIDKVVLHMDGSSTPVATTTKATTKASTTTKATTTQATTTKATTTKATEKPVETTKANNDVQADIWGDANLDGSVTVADAVTILQSIGNKDKYALSAQARANADVYHTGDGVTASDALTIQQVDAGKYKQSDLPIR